MQNPLAIPTFLAFSTQKTPTRFHEDPKCKMGVRAHICSTADEGSNEAARITRRGDGAAVWSHVRKS
jgi:hypothetical protein